MGTSTGHGGTDLGRRIREHRTRAGLSQEEAAAGAGMAVSYLAYLESNPDASPTPAALARLAAALGTTTRAITGAGLDLPPGRQPAEQRPELEPLGAAECALDPTMAWPSARSAGRALWSRDGSQEVAAAS
jgi:transcriptional regulator with XRE-family HTH domain